VIRPIVMPKLGLTMTEGMLAEWRVGPGDSVVPGDVLYVVETDKIANEVEASHAGVIDALLAEPGAVVLVGAPVCTLRIDGEEGVTAPVADHKPDPSPALPASAAPAAPGEKPRIIATPLARRRAQAAGVDLATIVGSGPRNRIMAGDLPDSTARATALAEPIAAPATAPDMAPSPTSDRMIRPNAWQQVTARRLSEAKRDIPHFYVFARADVTDLLALREQLNAGGDAPRLTVSHFIIAAVARALGAIPEMNRVWAGETIRQFTGIDIGLAVESPKGLVAPVLHGLSGLGLDGIAAAAGLLVARAREGRLAQSDLAGGAISISNVGMFGVSALVPIVNPGQSSILGVGASQPQFLPDAHGQPVLRQVLELALSCDHRVIDGALAARFLAAVCRQLERAASLLRCPSGT